MSRELCGGRCPWDKRTTYHSKLVFCPQDGLSGIVDFLAVATPLRIFGEVLLGVRLHWWEGVSNLIVGK